MAPWVPLAAVLAAVAHVTPQPLQAQPACDGLALPWTLEGPRLAEGLAERWTLRTGSETLGSGCVGSGGAASEPIGDLQTTPLVLRSAFRSAYPFDRNDGAAWTGKGFSAALSGGISFQTDWLRVVLHPLVAFQQNASFGVATTRSQTHPLAHPFQRLDWPQRLGEDAFTTFDPGQSVLAVRAGPAELALATENLWWGPARRYPILLGNSAPGFLQTRLGLSDPVSIGIGEVRLHLVWGRLDESDYFDTLDNDRRLLTGVFGEFRPSFLPGLTLGFAGIQHNDWKRGPELFLNIFTFAFNEEENTTGNGLLSVTASWLLPESGFEVYAEWARDDYWLDVEEFLVEPDHSQAYALGFEKLLGSGVPTMRIAGELAHLDPARTGRTPTVNFYTHDRIRQGHTHRGQLLGAAIGPGSNAGYLAFDLLRASRMFGAYAERIRRDDEVYRARFSPLYGFHGHDFEWTVGLHGVEGVGPLKVSWDAAVSRRKNRSFIGLDGVSWDFRRETNLALTVSAWWLPGA